MSAKADLSCHSAPTLAPRSSQPAWSSLWLLPLVVTLSPADAETRGYAVSLIHTAAHHSDDNCPKGGNGGPSELKERILAKMGYSPEQIKQIRANRDTDASGKVIDYRTRGTINGKPANVAIFPSSYPDLGIETVSGKLAYGFNLDGKSGADSFRDPETGETGIDNEMWRVLGCFNNYQVRRPVTPYSETIVWDTAVNTMPAWLISISGEDLSRDGEVTVKFERSLNIAMRDASGKLLRSSSYAIDPDPRSRNEFRGKLQNGTVVVQHGAKFYMQGESQFYAQLRLLDTHLRFKLEKDGSLSGLIGGYQPWLDYYYFMAIRGEDDAQVDLPGVYNALKRHADYDPDPSTGQNRAISAAYYLEAAPVYHVDSNGTAVATAVELNGPGPLSARPAQEQLSATAPAVEP